MKVAEAIHALEFQYAKIIAGTNTFHEQITLEVGKENLNQTLEFFIQAGFAVLMDLTAVDYLEPTQHSKVVYFLHNPTNLERIRVTVLVSREESIPSVIHLWAGAAWYEREIFDLFGVHFTAHPNLRRLLMPDEWIGHPLQKNYALTEEPVEFKHGVRPKVPSEIIPHVKKHTKA